MSSAPPAARCDRTIAAGCNALRTFCAATTAAAADICEPHCQSLTLIMADTKPCTSARSRPPASRLFALSCNVVFDEQLLATPKIKTHLILEVGLFQTTTRLFNGSGELTSCYYLANLMN